MYLAMDLFKWARRRARASYVYRCPCRCRWRPKIDKEKVEDDIEMAHVLDRMEDEPFTMGNHQDADESIMDAPGVGEVPSWQMPKLVIECSQRPGARIHKGTSVILPDAGNDLIAGIVGNVPTLLQVQPCWYLAYSMAVDGVSLQTMYRQVANSGPCILVVEDSSNCIFGAFLAEGLRPGLRSPTSHESFLFRYPRAGGAWRTQVFSAIQGHPAQFQAPRSREEEPQGEHWANYFENLKRCQAWALTESNGGVFCDTLGIIVGLDGPGLFIDQNLLRGVSWPSAAYGSPCLAAAGSGPDF
eukprot:CAMPEP_0206529750 /NCGR_PEP_ID=MMETSP0325_2-20121206/2773_1 /ASSEMBLY_ACC=CAM_ASM_000347 /TAXON_ID=2866 /ORGANISM="Crypthecodinium cohnii, Strain Seligo" /LENGTH=299 /DNA_ID=CAMNT_0054025697 /DNA_START=124 /DNA_END=1020 /DNA_ORIENTATION=-